MDAITPTDLVAQTDYEGSLNIPMSSLEIFSSRQTNQCRFMPAKEPRPLYLCCGRETEIGLPYCGYHYRLTRGSFGRGEA
ncbi:hypothetical protein [Bradyrhizobium elkanii]|uniref:hypothetical protein n=1 Tax=Bradyrhizobium elkanii TaxID=29448 RepID=UPI00272A03A0|nr:hypothetical protein [Bradyrhizobium elkanii]WLA80348.1 hypothetical protein QNJ99_33930 [Bradyrhizobium elkanii]